MEIEKYVIIVLRTLNLLAKQKNVSKNREYIESLASSLTPSQKQVFLNMSKAMILLTAGNVQVVREPQKFDDRYVDPWFELISRRLTRALNKIVPSFDVSDNPTREDYELANDLLPLLGSSSLTADEINQLAPNLSPEEKESSDIAGFDTLYRGLQNLSFNIVNFIMAKPNWQTQQPGVSTSYDKAESARFAAMQYENGLLISSNGPAAFFTINNPNKKGFAADRLSAFSREKEVIVSGVLKVDSWNIHLQGSMVDDSTGSSDILKTNIKIDGDDQTISFKSGDSFDETMQFDSEEEFINYVKFLIERRQPFPKIKLETVGKTYEYGPSEWSVLILVNATLQ